MWHGNLHNCDFLFSSAARFDFVPRGDPDCAIIADAALVAEDVVRRHFRPAYDDLAAMIDRLRARGATEILILGTPAPRGDEAQVRARVKDEPIDSGEPDLASRIYTLSQRLVKVECEEEILDAIAPASVPEVMPSGAAPDAPPPEADYFVVRPDAGEGDPGLMHIEQTASATQSSYSVWSSPGEAMNVINGKDVGDYGFHTDMEENPWWGADLGAVVPIAWIIVHNRVSGFQDRAKTLTVELAERPDAWVTVHTGMTQFGAAKAGQPLCLAAKREISARFIKLSLKEKQYLHLSKVEILTRLERPSPGTATATSAAASR